MPAPLVVADGQLLTANISCCVALSFCSLPWSSARLLNQDTCLFSTDISRAKASAPSQAKQDTRIAIDVDGIDTLLLHHKPSMTYSKYHANGQASLWHDIKHVPTRALEQVDDILLRIALCSWPAPALFRSACNCPQRRLEEGASPRGALLRVVSGVHSARIMS